MTDFNEKFRQYREIADGAVNSFCDELDCKPSILRESLIYSLAAGKRVRPAIMFAAADAVGVPQEDVINFALALELIHTYSLIHDDLPEMDNDDYRRGRLSNHKKFGAGNAVLAGDGLLNTAYSILLRECRKGEKSLAAAEYICNSVGIYGMIAGQSADLLHENDTEKDEETLKFIYSNKTGKLIIAACVVPSILSGGKFFSEFKEFGGKLGTLFQLTDDILDVEGNFEELGKSAGKDAAEGKYTAVSLYGLENSKLQADILYSDCLQILEGIGSDTSFFAGLAQYLITRKS